MWTSDSEGAKQTFDKMEMFVVRFISGQMAVYIWKMTDLYSEMWDSLVAQQ